MHSEGLRQLFYPGLQPARALFVADLCDQDRINGCNLQGFNSTSSSAVYTNKMRKYATSLSRDNYTIAKQRNIALFSARMQIASDDSKFFICVLKSGGTVR